MRRSRRRRSAATIGKEVTARSWRRRIEQVGFEHGFCVRQKPVLLVGAVRLAFVAHVRAAWRRRRHVSVLLTAVLDPQQRRRAVRAVHVRRRGSVGRDRGRRGVVREVRIARRARGESRRRVEVLEQVRRFVGRDRVASRVLQSLAALQRVDVAERGTFQTDRQRT